jgi:predicted DNA-binding transcriptional regulator AlpA
MDKMADLMNETEVSKFLGVSLACVRRWRLFGEGPEYRKVGPLVRYRPEAVNEWLNNQPVGGNGHRFEPARNRRLPTEGPGPRKPVSHAKGAAMIEASSAA